MRAMALGAVAVEVSRLAGGSCGGCGHTWGSSFRRRGGPTGAGVDGAAFASVVVALGVQINNTFWISTTPSYIEKKRMDSHPIIF